MLFRSLGAWILVVGWFGFNVMSAQTIDKVSGLVAMNSLMAMVGGTIAALVIGKNDPGFVHNGALAGLVAVCAGGTSARTRPEPEMTEVARGVYLFRTAPYGEVGLDGNAIAVVTEGGVLVFDTNGTPAAASAVDPMQGSPCHRASAYTRPKPSWQLGMLNRAAVA